MRWYSQLLFEVMLLVLILLFYNQLSLAGTSPLPPLLPGGAQTVLPAPLPPAGVREAGGWPEVPGQSPGQPVDWAGVEVAAAGEQAILVGSHYPDLHFRD